MPIKRRASKRGKQLDDGQVDDLFFGPGTCLFNGYGYLAPYDDGLWSEKPPEVQAAVLSEMRADWDRQGLKLLAAWAARSEDELHIARRFHGDPAEPWAMREFGEPRQ